MARSSPGGVADGLPRAADGEPLLHRWFVVAMIVLSVVAVVLTVVALSTRTAPPSEELPPAARRPPGTATVTHERGRIVLGETQDEETEAASCAPNVRVVGDDGGRATARRALQTLCRQLSGGSDALALAAAGLERLDREEGIVRIALGAATGVDSSARIEDDTLVVELAPKFQFDNATEAAPFLAHELAHIGGPRWPGASPDVADELSALQAQDELCTRLLLGEDAPRGCADAADVLASDDPGGALRDAGYPG